MPETLLKALMEATGLSRRRAFAAIREGRVTDEGNLVVDPSRSSFGRRITLDGSPVQRDGGPKTYLMLNKPTGVVTTLSDDLGRGSVLDLVPYGLLAPGLHPVGRLDRDTTGLLLLTNDGDLTQRLTHPSNEIDKEYHVATDPKPEDGDLEALARGVEVDGRVRRPVKVTKLVEEPRFDFAITLREGRNRQVRRMVQGLGGRVVRLERVREGPLALGSLPPGRVRRLTYRELSRLGVRVEQ